jgi:CubicO group peptidase (beta-lactamase class C family)
VLDSTFLRACEDAASRWGVPALAVGVSVGGEVESCSVACAADAIFRVASITKPFTATLALELLDPEGTTGVWPADVRVRHLLSHTTGYDGECGDLARFGDGDDALPALVAELPGVRRFLGVEEAWSYANTGFWLAGALAAERAQLTYEEALHERVLRPAGLESTSFGEPDLAGSGPDADKGPYPRARRPSGGLVSNVFDLLRFARWHLEQPSSALMRTVHARPVAGVYGLGVWGQRVGDAEVWGHPGSYGGFASSLLVVPAHDAAFVGLTSSGVGGKALYELEDEFFERLLGERRPVPETLELPAAAREALTGAYVNGDSRYEVALAPAGLTVAFDDGEHDARAIGERTFEIAAGTRVRERFDFPLDGFARFESRLAERVA